MALGPWISAFGAGAASLKRSRQEDRFEEDRRAERADAKAERERRRQMEELSLEMRLRDSGYVPEGDVPAGDTGISGQSLDDIVGAATGSPMAGVHRDVGSRYGGGPKGYRYDKMNPAAEGQRLEHRIKQATVAKLESDARRPAAAGALVKVVRNGKTVYVRPEEAVGQEVPVSPEDTPDASPLRGQYNSDPTVRESASVVAAYKKVRAAATNPSPAGDMSLVFGFMKMLDPGSTVREGEYANAQNTAGVPDRVRNLYNKALAGETLSPTQRADFLSQAGHIVKSQRELHKSVRDRYTGIATRSRLNPADIVSDPFDGVELDGPKAYSPDNPYARSPR